MRGKALFSGTLAGVLIGLLALLVMLMPGRGADTSVQAWGGGGGTPSVFGIDVDPFDGGGNGESVLNDI